MIKQKAKLYKGKRIVMGNKNLVTKYEIHIDDIPELGNDLEVDGDTTKEDSKFIYFDVTAIDEILHIIIFAMLVNDGTQISPAGYYCLDYNSEGKNFIKKIAVPLGYKMNDSTVITESFVKEILLPLGCIEITESEFYKL